LATGGLEPVSIFFPFKKPFNDVENFYFKLTEVLKINSEKNQIETSIGNLKYDKLIIATNSNITFFLEIPTSKNM
jgi:NADH dehydrogenase